MYEQSAKNVCTPENRVRNSDHHMLYLYRIAAALIFIKSYLDRIQEECPPNF